MTLEPKQQTVPAHGGRLVDLIVAGAEREALIERLPSLPVLRLSPRALSDLELLAVGGYSPLEGFMTEDDYLSVVKEMRLTGGLPWPMPITLALSTSEAKGVREGRRSEEHTSELQSQ